MSNGRQSPGSGGPPGNGEPARTASLEVGSGAEGDLTVHLGGWLDNQTVPPVWDECRQLLRARSPRRFVVEAAGVSYCDGAGIAMLVDFRRTAAKGVFEVEIRHLPADYSQLLEVFDPSEFVDTACAKPQPACLPEEVGRAAVGLLHDMRQLISFIGELTAALAAAVRHPRHVRWRDALLAAENTGVNALPIVALISFLIGLIMAFQSAIPMRQFGAEIFVADLVALSMLRELGPLMTAILLAGRSGSAFAAEIGTMKVNEEINALTTMGLDPVRFLVVTRVVAAVVMTPLLTLFADLMGLVGGAVVFRSLDFPLVTYVHEALGALHLRDLVGGLVKSVVFGILVAGVGCLRGLQTKTGASAVGLSTTRAVVSGILLIVLADGLFSVIYYHLGL
jgi:phospholipid/cholesterol/gamma-HCH transport system permease protein